MNRAVKPRVGVLGLFVRGLAALGLSAVFAPALLLGVILHIDLPLGRRLTAQALATLLSNTFQGRISIGTLSGVSSQISTMSAFETAIQPSVQSRFS